MPLELVRCALGGPEGGDGLIAPVRGFEAAGRGLRKDPGREVRSEQAKGSMRGVDGGKQAPVGVLRGESLGDRGCAGGRECPVDQGGGFRECVGMTGAGEYAHLVDEQVSGRRVFVASFEYGQGFGQFVGGAGASEREGPAGGSHAREVDDRACLRRRLNQVVDDEGRRNAPGAMQRWIRHGFRQGADAHGKEIQVGLVTAEVEVAVPERKTRPYRADRRAVRRGRRWVRVALWREQCGEGFRKRGRGIAGQQFGIVVAHGCGEAIGELCHGLRVAPLSGP